MLIPGRICPKSDSPLLECIATCHTGDCYALNIPDSLFAEKLEHQGKPPAYVPILKPNSFDAASSSDFEAAIRERLSLITPQMKHCTAVRYLKDASFTLFMGRAVQGILKSDSKDLVPCYENLLKGKIDEDRMARLDEIIDKLKGTPPKKGSVEIQAQRMKGAFSLLMAHKLQEYN